MNESPFPTLAEQLALDAERPSTTTDLEPLLLLVEGRLDDAAVSELVTQARAAAPPSSLVAVASDGVVRTAPAGAADPTDPEVWALGDVRHLDDVRVLLAAIPGADVVLVAPPRQLTDDLLERLVRAAELDSVCASISVVGLLADGGTADATERGIPPPAVRTPEWDLVLIRRDAVNVALENAEAVTQGEVLRTGTVRELLAHVLAAPGFVHRSIADGERAAERAGDRSTGRGPRPSILRVAIDARCFGERITGTQVQLVNLMKALAGAPGDVEITALAPLTIHPSVRALVEPLRDSMQFSADVADTPDVFHRPNQIPSLLELVECLGYGRRLVLTHQDMILDRTPAFFYSDDMWREFRHATEAALASADHVAFFSKHAALDAASDGFLDPERATVVPLGVDHVETTGDARLPAEVAALGGRPFLVVVGTSLAHKNRVFALRVLRELIDRSWDGALVLAGGDFPWGSSLHDERMMLDRDAQVRERVIDVGHVSETEKRALYRDSALVLFPSLYEGFGLIPFEAAAFGTACLYAWRGPMREFLPSAGALPADYSAGATASKVLELLDKPKLQTELVADIRSAATALTWEQTARGYVEVYRRAVGAAPRPLERAILDSAKLTRKEQQLVYAYRYRPAFATGVDQVMAVGAAVMRSRVGRKWDSRRKRKHDQDH